MSVEVVDSVRLRELLRQFLRADSDFDAFCLDHFGAVRLRFGSGMDRVQKENLLLTHAPSLQAILQALSQSFPTKAGWQSMQVKEGKPVVDLASADGRSRVSRLGFLLVGGLAALALILVGLWRVLRPPAAVCGALVLDDLFLLKQPTTEDALQLALDARLRHGGQPSGPVNLTRAVLVVMDKQPERSPYEISASYDLLVSGDQSESALAQRLTVGEIDRIVLRLGFTRQTAAYQYTAKLQLRYNGSCLVESEPFVLAREAARWPAAVPPPSVRPTK